MNGVIETLKLMFSRRWIVATLIVVLSIAVFIRLGVWQLDRLEQRQASNAQITAVLEGEPLRLPEDDVPEDTRLLNNRDVIVSGTYDYANQRLLVLQNWGGKSGVNLITPLLLEGGETAVLVDRGWIPDEEADVSIIENSYNPLPSETVTGYIAQSQTLRRQTSNNASVRPENEIYRVDVAAIEAQLPYELYDFYIVQAPKENDLDAFPYRKTRIIDLSEGSHLSYAIQWFLFALVLAILFPIFIRRRSL